MRYSQDTNTTSLTIDHPQQAQLLGIFPAPGLNTNTSYSQDGDTFFQPPNSHIYPGIDIRARLPSSAASASTGMAHTHHHHRPSTLPQPGPQISTRDQYAQATPSFKRAAEHSSRSPSMPTSVVRRHPISPTPSHLSGFTTPATRMDASQFPGRPSTPNIPPLQPVQTFGSLHYMDGTATPIKVDIAGIIDKGFFMADGQWTCYRRNYFNCVCSFSLNPHCPGSLIQYSPPNSNQSLQVHGFSMSISAVVSDNDQQNIELVQHTPKRDKGPTAKPDRVPLEPKQGVGHHHMNLYGDSAAVGGPRGMYSDAYGGQGAGQAAATEHTFERIQFKQATQNNGKRRAAQQYYHLVVELWANVGTQASDSPLKVAVRKSAKMIVRGRSPGHYQNDRRGSQSSGPGGSAGTLGNYAPLSGLNDMSPTGLLGSTGSTAYSTPYENRNTAQASVRHHVVPAEMMMSPEEERKYMDRKPYMYYPGNHDMDEPDSIWKQRPEISQASANMEPATKIEYDITGPSRAFRAPPLARCGPFEGKPTSHGFYPTPSMLSPSGVNTTMT
ncbi:hypothetical protein B0I35DRAFT_12688 [Stachybotrys elegans]|uniref:NDT80 domain-containing protein n=1 Tax=Stachybotrys elegans TaxID=80388 RepID=A0A8K0T555_9HYPO|nr:hypothetical protein B0I35DRAFT_12688 [Stachybotrys elegans]